MARNRLLALLIVAATAAFVVGSALEKSEAKEQPAEHAAEETGTHVEGEGGEATEAGHSEATSHDESSGGEDLLGVDPESTPLVILAVVASLAMALAVWLRPAVRALIAIVALALVAFVALDIREVLHQLDESREGVAAVAGVVALLHAAAAILASMHFREARLP